jgi:hypothetical protein
MFEVRNNRLFIAENLFHFRDNLYEIYGDHGHGGRVFISAPWQLCLHQCSIHTYHEGMLTMGCITKGLSLTAQLQLVQQAAVPRVSVSLHSNSWYSKLQYHETQSHCTATAGTASCSTKDLSLTAQLQLVEQAAVPRVSVSLHSNSCYSKLQYHKTQSHCTACAVTVGCNTRDSVSLYWYRRL